MSTNPRLKPRSMLSREEIPTRKVTNRIFSIMMCLIASIVKYEVVAPFFDLDRIRSIAEMTVMVNDTMINVIPTEVRVMCSKKESDGRPVDNQLPMTDWSANQDDNYSWGNPRTSSKQPTPVQKRMNQPFPMQK